MTVVCCQVEVSAMGRSLVQRSPTASGVCVCVCDHETSKNRRFWPTGGCRAMKEKQYNYIRCLNCACFCIGAGDLGLTP